MGLAWDLARVAPSLLVGVWLILVARAVNRDAPATPAVAALVPFLALRGLLNVFAPFWFVPGAEEVARRVWPALDVFVATAALLWFSALPHRTRTWTGTPGFRVVTTAAGVVLGFVLAVFPAWYWGVGDRAGPLFWVNGLKFVVYAMLALTFLRAYAADWAGPWRRTGAWLAVAFALDAVHWAFADVVWVEIVGVMLEDVRRAPDHWARLVAVVPLAWFFAASLRHGWRSPVRGIRRGCRAVLAGALLPALVSTVLLDLVVFGVMGREVANDALVLWLDALWTAAVPFVVWMVVRHVPDGVDHWIAGREDAEVVARSGDDPLIRAVPPADAAP